VPNHETGEFVSPVRKNRWLRTRETGLPRVAEVFDQKSMCQC
jgi:hypothetical protein